VRRIMGSVIMARLGMGRFGINSIPCSRYV
jgi:hypothetical protein